MAAVEDAGVTVVGLNFFAGDLAGPECGVLSIPGRAAEFAENVEIAVGIDEQDQLGIQQLLLAAQAAGRIGATVLLEPVSGPEPYPLRTTSVPVVAVAGRSRLTPEQLRRAGIQAAYPLSELEPDPQRSIANAAPLLRRVGCRIAQDWLA